MKKYILLVIIMLITLTACNTSSASNDCLFVDSEGEKSINYNPKDVALLYPSFGDMWLASGGSISIGVEDDITRGYANSDIKIVGNGTGKDINLESLVSAKPGFVILSSDFPNHKTIASNLKSYGIKYGIFDFASYDDYLNVLEIFCKINKNDEAFNKYGTSQKAKIDEIITGAKKEESKKVLLLRSQGSKEKLSSLTKENFVGAMVNDLGCINIADNNISISVDLSFEAILKEDPDVILVVPMGDEEKAFANAKKAFQDELWQNLTAIKNDKIYYLEKDLFHYKPNTRWEDAYELLKNRIFNS